MIPFKSTTGMKFFVYIFQSILVDVGINLGGRNVSVAKHELY
jgi:hypothetical protein